MKTKVKNMKKNSCIIGLCLLLMTTSLAGITSAESMFDNWGMLRHDAANTGHSLSAIPEYDTVQWMKTDIQPHQDSIRVVDGYVYVITGTGDNVPIYRYEAYSGEIDEEWSIGGYNVYFTINDGRIYIAKGTGTLYCFDVETLNLIWSYELESSYGFSELTVTEGKILYTNSETEKLYCLDAAGNGDGTTSLLWSSQDYNLFANFPPAVYNGKVYAIGTRQGYQSSYLRCFDLESTGDEVASEWTFTVDREPGGITIVDDKIYILDDSRYYDEHVYCANAQTGALLWKSEAIRDFHKSCPAVADGKVFIVGTATLYCYDADAIGEDIAPLWTKEFSGSTATSIGPTYANGQVYIASSDMYGNGYLSAIDAENEHDILMEIPLEEGLKSAPVIYDGYVYSTSTRDLYCIGGRNHAPMTPDTPDGPEEGLVDHDYTFILRNITDYDESDLTITIDWGEDENETIGPLPSGIEEIPVSHSWPTAGVYTVQVKTSDGEKESDWSEPLTIHVAFLDIIITGGMGVTIDLQNHLNETKHGRYVDWTMDLVGGTFPGFHINKHMSGTEYLEAGGSTRITQPVFALGRFNIEVTVQATGEPVITEEKAAFVLFFYVFTLVGE